ncbi:MAG: hypothetical protein ACLUZZ_01515 [Alistipes inops]
MFDHGSVRTAAGGLRGVNDCGLVTFDRQVRKDAYWLYKANWNREDPFIHIASVRERRRSDKIQTVTVYTNLPVAELWCQRVSLDPCPQWWRSDGVSCGWAKEGSFCRHRRRR